MTTAGQDAIPDVDLAAAVDAGMVTYAHDGEEQARDVAAATAVAAAHLRRLLPDPHAGVDWGNTGLGRVMPIIPASPGAGASVVAAALADALAELGWRVLVADMADVARSGLAYASTSDGPVTPVPDGDGGTVDTVRLCWTWRRSVLVARVEADVPVLAPGLIPPPPCWRPPAQFGTPHITIADCSVDAWRLAAHPLTGVGAWLRAGTPAPRPVLVVRPSRPSLRAAESVLTRLAPWTSRGLAVSPAAMAVVGVRKGWPPGVVGAAGRRVTSLLDRTVMLPHEPTVETDGITPEPTSEHLREAFAPLIHAWGLAPPQHHSRRPRRLLGGRR